MSAIITEKFRAHNATNFFESFTESSPNTYYLFIGKATPFTTGTSGGSHHHHRQQIVFPENFITGTQ